MKNTKLIIWDMDGVKYPITPLFQDRYTEAVAIAASKLIPNMLFENALVLAKKSKEETHRSMKVFVDNYRLDALTLGMTAEPELDLGFLIPSPSFKEKLYKIDCDQMILTEANPIWKDRILTQLDLHDFYANRHVITKADYPGHTKRDRHPFDLALSRSGHNAEDALIPEDTEHNLEIPKEMGLITVLIDPSSSKKQKHFVDYIFRDAEEFVDYFAGQRTLTLS